MKKIIILLLTLVCDLGMVYAVGGKCGDDLRWNFDSKTGVLEIVGTGRFTTGYGGEDVPWYTYRNAITSVKISDGLTAIPSYCFYKCSRITSITLPNSVEEIYYNAFDGCSKLTSVILSSSMKRIGRNAFANCTGLTSITIPSSVEVIGYYAFSKCENLTNVNLTRPKIIDEYAFAGCKKLVSINIPNTVWTINNGAFSGCTSLEEITIPNSVTRICKYAFNNCSNLKSIKINVKRTNSLTIYDYAFANCTSLEYVVLPINLYFGGSRIFEGCTSLKKVYYCTEKMRNYSWSSNVPKTTECITYDSFSPPVITASLPPLLVMVDGLSELADPTNNNRIDAGEQCTVKFKIRNSGKGTAMNCEARVKLSGMTSGISVKSVKLPNILVGQTCEVNIPIISDLNTQDGKLTMTIEVYEPNGFGIAPFDLTVATKAYEAPYLQVVDYQIASTSGQIKKMEPFTLSFYVQNTKYGNAEQVKVKVNLPSNVFVMDGEQEKTFPLIKSGEAKPIQLSLVANNNYSNTNIPITIDVKEKHGRFAENKQLDIALNQTASSSINIAAKDEPKQERKEIRLASIGSAVDKNIPVSKEQNKNTFVVIIANENYQQVANVPFALNDGNIFKQYCEKTLGIPASNIRFVANATGNNIRYEVNWLNKVIQAYNGQAKIIFYYAGHGVPDEQSKTAFLLPVDGNGSDVTTGYKLDDLYRTLGELPSQAVTIFMDACFSGSKREEGMLASARGVALKAKSGVPQGNMVVFSAATGDETAYPNNDEQHGLFTYYLLKKLQETKGDVTLQDLGSYITTNVRQQSIVKNGKSQTPCVTPSAAIGSDWQNWKLK